jgi:hypothetical protein
MKPIRRVQKDGLDDSACRMRRKCSVQLPGSLIGEKKTAAVPRLGAGSMQGASSRRRG